MILSTPPFFRRVRPGNAHLFAVGVVFMVMVAAGFGLMMETGEDRGYRLPHQRQQEALKKAREHTQGLRRSVTEKKKVLALQVEEERKNQQIEALEIEQQSLLDQKDALAQEMAEKSSQIEQLEEEFDQYRTVTQKRLRQKGLGRQWDTFPLRDGRVLKNVTLRSVDDGGLNVLHSAGMARIPVRDLSEDLCRAYDLSTEDSLRLREQERKQQRELFARCRREAERKNRLRKQPRRHTATRSGNPKQDRRALLAHIHRLESRYIRAKGRYETARIKAQTSKSRSVPGTLRSWKSHLGNLHREKSRIRAAIYASVRELQSLDPGYTYDMHVLDGHGR